MAKMYLKFNTAVIKEVFIDSDLTTFGRKSDNDIVIDHPTVSGHHGRLVREDDHYAVEDLNSTNGTFINGRRVKSGKIKDRDQIGVAGHIFDFYDDDSVSIPLTIVESKPKSVLPHVAQTPPAPTPVHEDPPTKPAPESAAPALEAVEAAKAATPPAPAMEAPGVENFCLSVIAGAVDGKTKIPLKDTVTYIGAKETAAVRIKDFLAPDLAGVITRRTEGFVLKALKSGYIKVDNVPVQDQILLKDRARLEIGSAIMLFVKTD